MLVKLIKNKEPIFDKISGLLNSQKISEEIIYNGIPISHLEKNWILLKLDDFDGYLTENLDFDVYLFENKKRWKVKKHKILSLQEKIYLDSKSEDILSYDCFYDIYLNLMLIKIPFDDLEKVELDFDQEIDYKNLSISYAKEDYSFVKKNIEDIGKFKIDYKWVKYYFLGPEKLCFKIIFEDLEKIDFKYTEGIIYSECKVIGLVEYIHTNTILFLSLISIKKFLNQIKSLTEREPTLFLGLPYETVLIEETTKTYGLFFTQNLINQEETIESSGKIKIIETKILDKETIIKDIDGNKINSSGNIILSITSNKMGLQILKEIPFASYLWYLKESLNKKNEFVIEFNLLKPNKNNLILKDSEANVQYVLRESKLDKFKKKELFLISNKDYFLLKNSISYIFYKEKNIFLFELNDIFLSLMIEFLEGNENGNKMLNIIEKFKFSKTPIIFGIKHVKEYSPRHFGFKLLIQKKYKSVEEIELKLKGKEKIKKFLTELFDN